MLEIDPENRIILLVRAGSRSYGIDVAGSDEDFVGVFVPSLRRLVSLAGFGMETLTGAKPDFTLHEVGKFCGLALKGNPAILETLWNPDVVREDEWGRELRGMRRAFLHRGSLEVYLAYAESQMKKMVAGERLRGKPGAHLLRLLHSGLALGRTGEVQVRADDDLAELLLRVRRGELSTDEVLERARPLLAELSELSGHNPLPERPDTDRVNDFVIRARLARL